MRLVVRNGSASVIGMADYDLHLYERRNFAVKPSNWIGERFFSAENDRVAIEQVHRIRDSLPKKTVSVALHRIGEVEPFWSMDFPDV
jgi:hypothetical protein